MIFQPPRSGGTLLLRLFDHHPQIHVWPVPEDPKNGSFSLASVNGLGLAKAATNFDHAKMPSYFDAKWFNLISKSHNKFTAGFNAWRNYQNLYGDKEYVLIHFAPDPKSDVRQYISWFNNQYPTGRLVFTARNPADWLYSATNLKNSNRYTGDPEKALQDYIHFYNEFSAYLPKNSIVLEFDELVTDSKKVLTTLCTELGVGWHENMEKTTLNNCLVPQNSSNVTNVHHYQPSKSVLGRGKNLDASVDLSEATRCYKKMLERKLR